MIEKGFMPRSIPRDQADVQAQLRLNGKAMVSRGVITHGEGEQREIQYEEYSLDDQPVISLVLRY